MRPSGRLPVCACLACRPHESEVVLAWHQYEMLTVGRQIARMPSAAVQPYQKVALSALCQPITVDLLFPFHNNFRPYAASAPQSIDMVENHLRNYIKTYLCGERLLKLLKYVKNCMKAAPLSSRRLKMLFGRKRATLCLCSLSVAFVCKDYLVPRPRSEKQFIELE